MDRPLTKWMTTTQTEELFSRLAEETLALNRQRAACDDAIRNARTAAQARYLAQVQQANEALSEFRRERERISSDAGRRPEPQFTLTDVKRRDSEKAARRRFCDPDSAAPLLKQMRDKQEVAETRRWEEMQEAEQQKLLQQEYVQDVREDAARNAEEKRRALTQQHQEMSVRQHRRETERMSRQAEDRCCNHGLNLQQRRARNNLTDARRRAQKDAVSQNLAAIHQQDADARARRDEEQDQEVKLYQSKQAKQQRDKDGRRAADRKSVSDGRRGQVKASRERTLQEDRGGQQSSQDVLQAARRQAVQQRRDAQDRREDNVRVFRDNVRTAEDKHACNEREKKERQAEFRACRDAAERKERRRRRRIQRRLLSAAGIREDLIRAVLARTTGEPGEPGGPAAGMDDDQDSERLPRLDSSQTHSIKHDEPLSHRSLQEDNLVPPPVFPPGNQNAPAPMLPEDMRGEYRSALSNDPLPKRRPLAPRSCRQLREVLLELSSKEERPPRLDADEMGLMRRYQVPPLLQEDKLVLPLIPPAALRDSSHVLTEKQMRGEYRSALRNDQLNKRRPAAPLPHTELPHAFIEDDMRGEYRTALSNEQLNKRRPKAGPEPGRSQPCPPCPSKPPKRRFWGIVPCLPPVYTQKADWRI